MDAKKISDSTTIAAPADVVFAIVADPRQHSRIDGSGSVQGFVEGPERLSQGAEFGIAMKLFGLRYKIGNRVVEFEEDRRIAWRHYGGHRWRYELEPTPEGDTLVTETFDFSHHGPLASLFITSLGFPERNRRGIAATLTRLKDAAESDAKVA